MPSFLELLESSDPEDAPSGGFVPLDVLASVKTEGGRRRRRRQRRNLAFVGVAMVAIGVPALALAGTGDDAEEVRVADDGDRDGGRDDASVGVTSTTLGTEVLGVVIERPAGEATDDTTTETTTPTTARPRPTTTPPTEPPPTEPPLVCSNSVDPACGPFSWSPAPGPNAGMSHSDPGVLTIGPSETLTFDVTWSDPDARPVYFDDDTDGILLQQSCATDGQRFGPWTPPAPDGGSATQSVSYTAPAEAGTYSVTLYAASYNGDCVYDAYGSEAQVTFTVTVL